MAVPTGDTFPKTVRPPKVSIWLHEIPQYFKYLNNLPRKTDL